MKNVGQEPNTINFGTNSLSLRMLGVTASVGVAAKHTMWKICLSVVILGAAVNCMAIDTGQSRAASEYSTWITAMKSAERGPFSRIRWFCNDGQILPPASYACKTFGGGAQHGEWSERTRILRAAGYEIANFYADLEIDAFVNNVATTDRFAQMLIEQFLVRIDDGWIVRRARFYRGAFQEEGERRGARKLLFKLAENRDWLTYRYLLLRSAAQLLAHGSDTVSIKDIRQLSASLAERDHAFVALRNKIHGSLELADATGINAYSQTLSESELKADYERLAMLIEHVFSTDITTKLHSLAATAAGSGDIAAMANAASDALAQNDEARVRFGLLARLLADLRLRLTVPNGPRQRLALIDTSLMIETELFTTAAVLKTKLSGFTRAEHLAILNDSLLALFGVGLLTRRQLSAAGSELERLLLPGVIDAQTYKHQLDYLALAPHWATQALRRFFGAGMEKLSSIEPRADLYIQDHLRGSPMFFFASLIDRMTRDANSLAGVSNEFFGQNVGAGLRRLNPGLARGILRIALAGNIADLDPDGIYLLSETVSELPPVAGILTAGEGNPLSHVQLLARNLGIPNVGVDQSLLEQLKAHSGETIILAVSPAGSVRINIDDASVAETSSETSGSIHQRALIKVDLVKLDLKERQFLTLSELRASDSGRIVGPKAAKLGELKHHYPAAVAEGLAIPFAIFKDLLDQPMAETGTTVFEWMQHGYRELETLPLGSAERRAATESFRASLQHTIRNADPGDDFRAQLRAKLVEVFGIDGTFGVFVRSDTNVEDLPGFTGAGLNLTVANVVGIDNIFEAISRVWASPFSARSFAWRQTLMDKPEHVYPAVLLMLSVDADKSGVLVTQDIDSGDRSWISVAVNEGVGGAVDGQSAESIRVNTVTGKVLLMAQSTASIRRKINLTGGVQKLPVSSSDQILDDDEIAQLITFAKELPQRFPAIVDALGYAMPVDIEFGFLDGDLRLFQIRPFLDSDEARGNELLRELDAPLAAHAGATVALDEIP